MGLNCSPGPVQNEALTEHTEVNKNSSIFSLAEGYEKQLVADKGCSMFYMQGNEIENGY